MKVSYSSSLWSKGKRPYGLRQKVNWQFEFTGLKRCIPAVYCFRQGIVFDFITFLDETKVRGFFDQYENIEGNFTPLQRRCAKQEHPYQAVPVKEIWINGRQVTGSYSSSSGVSISWTEQERNFTAIRKAYSSILKSTACFACERYCIPYPETDSKVDKFLRSMRLGRVKSLKLITHSVQRFYPLGLQFDLSPNDKNKVVRFDHPITGVAHALYFQDAEIADLPLHPGDDQKLYVMQSAYEIDPDLPQGDTLQFNSSMQYSEPTAGRNKAIEDKYRSVKDKYKLTKDKYEPSMVSSIGIIGGASGPTAIFVTGKNIQNSVPVGLHGLPLSICFSIPSLIREEVSHFVLDGINIQYCDSKEYCFGTQIPASGIQK